MERVVIHSSKRITSFCLATFFRQKQILVLTNWKLIELTAKACCEFVFSRSSKALHFFFWWMPRHFSSSWLCESVFWIILDARGPGYKKRFLTPEMKWKTNLTPKDLVLGYTKSELVNFFDYLIRLFEYLQQSYNVVMYLLTKVIQLCKKVFL